MSVAQFQPTAPPQPDAPMKIGKPGHLWQLDVLRAAAILAVFGFHLIEVVHGHNGFLTTWQNWLVLHGEIEQQGRWNWLFFPLPLGDIGVTLFFVISGFCIHLSVLQARRKIVGGRFNFWNFMWRRAWRIYPAYLIVLAALAVWLYRHPAQTPGIHGRADLATHLLLIHNLFDRFFYSINGSFWSLGVEWQFYLMYPVLFLWLRDRRGAWAAMGLAIGISGITQIVIAASGTQSPAWIASPLMTWINWCWGALIADSWVSGRRCFDIGRWSALVWLIAIFAIVFVPTRYVHDKIWAFAIAMSLEQYIHRRREPMRLERWAIPVGLCSYSLYLLHQPLIEPLLRAAHRVGIPAWPAMDLTVTGFAALVICVAVSYASFRAIEIPGVRAGSALWRRIARSAPKVQPENAHG